MSMYIPSSLLELLSNMIDTRSHILWPDCDHGPWADFGLVLKWMAVKVRLQVAIDEGVLQFV